MLYSFSLVDSSLLDLFVIPVNSGIQLLVFMGTRFRGHDEIFREYAGSPQNLSVMTMRFVRLLHCVLAQSGDAKTGDKHT